MGSVIDIHILQQLPPNVVNRDGDNRPKTTMYGGSQRMRVSSQAWKKATRDLIHRQDTDMSLFASRSRQFNDMLAERATTPIDGVPEVVMQVAAIHVMKPLGVKPDPKHWGWSLAPQLYGNHVWETLADTTMSIIRQYAEANGDDPWEYWPAELGRTPDDDPAVKQFSEEFDQALAGQVKALRALIRDDHSVDVALFGRMNAGDDRVDESRVEGAVSVAPAFSVDPITPEPDYYSTVDDSVHAVGFAHSDVPEYVHGLLYRYATIDLDQLAHNLQDDALTVEAARWFVHAYATSMPAGKSHAYAPFTMPQLILLQARSDRAVSLADAFRTPVTGPDAIRQATSRLFDHLTDVQATWGLESAPMYVTAVEPAADMVSDTVTRGSLPDMLDMVLPFGV